MNNLKSINPQLGYYLAGLIEGDGNIWTQKTVKSPKGRIHNPQITFSSSINDLVLYEHIKGILGTGGLFKEKSCNVYIYRISDKDTLIKVITLINGKFRTPKIVYLHRAIDYINLVHNLDIKKLPLDNSHLRDNAWLAGITDADGNFQISLNGTYGLNNSVSRGRVICSFSIVQRLIDKPTGLSCLPFMTKIADTFQCKINYKRDNLITFVAGANSKHYLTKSYFDKYPLMTSKHLNYLCFLQGLSYLGKCLTDKEIIEIQAIKNSMNNKRTYFNWDHLNNFYSEE